jgi:hypothetical protein
MFLIEKKKLPRDFLQYYFDFFNYAITMMWGYSTIDKNDKYSLYSSWPTLRAWILKDKRAPYPAQHLPKKMTELFSEEEKNTDVKIIYSQLLERIEAAKKSSSVS